MYICFIVLRTSHCNCLIKTHLAMKYYSIPFDLMIPGHPGWHAMGRSPSSLSDHYKISPHDLCFLRKPAGLRALRAGQCRWSHGALKRNNPNIAVWVQGNLSPNFSKLNIVQHIRSLRQKEATFPLLVVSPSCSSQSVTVTGQSLMDQAAVLACQPVTSRPISTEAENADFWGPATSNRGQTMLKTLSGIPLFKSCRDPQRAAAAYPWHRIRPIFFLVWTSGRSKSKASTSACDAFM